MKEVFYCLMILAAFIVRLAAQSPEAVSTEKSSPPSSSPAAPTPATQSGGGTSFLGKEIPALDAGSEVLTWDGKIWNIQDQRVFRARFEK